MIWRYLTGCLSSHSTQGAAGIFPHSLFLLGPPSFHSSLPPTNFLLRKHLKCQGWRHVWTMFLLLLNVYTVLLPAPWCRLQPHGLSESSAEYLFSSRILSCALIGQTSRCHSPYFYIPTFSRDVHFQFIHHYIPRNGIAGFYGNSIFDFLRNFHTFSP